MLSSRWRYSASWFCFGFFPFLFYFLRRGAVGVLFPELPLVIFESCHFPPSTVSVRDVALDPYCHRCCWWGTSEIAGSSAVCSSLGMGGREWNGTGVAGVSALTGVVGAAAGGSGGGEAESWCPVAWGTDLQGLLPLPSSSLLAGGAVTRPPDSCVPPTQLLRLLRGSGPSYCGQGFRTTGTAFIVPLVLPPPCGPVHPPLDNRCVEFSSILLCGAESPLLSYGCFTGFTGCRLRVYTCGRFILIFGKTNTIM